MTLTLQQIKQHLNIDSGFTADDAYLTALSGVAEAAVSKHIGVNLTDIANDNGGAIPAPLSHAMLLLVGNYYANRESVAFASAQALPLSYNYLIDLYKDYR